ncbi:hypothetical protein BDN72DRAFT_612655 [Pluteus cervinus]|uniref:Uncharacterized protein n=1 Tax=Pluteus cervinus TaxID=181527 RepID=A0ACD3AVW2_9AGAR|nr:hypothetical protein BDN72DRAFT_612655 [Pluteus cervinus]
MEIDTRDYHAFEFPLDLEREIFTIAFRQNRRDVRNLLLVSKQVFHWIISLCYEVIIAGSAGGWPRKLNNDQLQKYGHLVRHLHTRDTGLIAHCPNVFNLAVWASPRQIDIEAILERPITRISINIHKFFSPTPPIIAFCSRITHLDVSISEWDPKDVLPHFGVLSHLAIFENLPHHIFGACLEVTRGSGLKVIILVSRGLETRLTPVYEGERKLNDDPRIVRVVFERRYQEDWEEGAWGGVDMWVLADEILESRRITGEGEKAGALQS